MPELIEELYCSQQIVIPPKFPYILKQYAKSAIKTQPYDLLQWSYEYFKALSEGKKPPVKLRIEYPIYATEGGLTRGYLKVLANQLEGITSIPLDTLYNLWKGACLDPQELTRILCLCSVYKRYTHLNYLYFFAVASALLTKNVTNTMILACETLTKEPEGGSAAIPADNFIQMYMLIAEIDASKPMRYINGFLEGPGHKHSASSRICEEEGNGGEQYDVDGVTDYTSTTSKDKGSNAENKLREMSGLVVEDLKEEETGKDTDMTGVIQIYVFDEEGNQVDLEIDGEHKDQGVSEEVKAEADTDDDGEKYSDQQQHEEGEEEQKKEVVVTDLVKLEKMRIQAFVNDCYEARLERRLDLTDTFEELAEIVDKFKMTNYDLSMIAGRQMSTTSGEFVVQYIEKEILGYVNEQIAILPDPDLKKKKAKPEEVLMIRALLEQFFEDVADIVFADIEEVEEEEVAIPEITLICPISGIGPIIDDIIVREFCDYVNETAATQSGLFMPRNIRYFLCPPLEKFPENIEEDLGTEHFQSFNDFTKDHVVEQPEI